ncbi:MAG: hypothetical protein ACFFBD_21540 [Candidatus Hodarchaeota archaeon]
MQGSWNYLIDPGFFGWIALILCLFGVGALIWLIIWVENSQDMTMKGRLFGGILRAVLMALFLGWGLFFWLMYEAITV